MTNDTDGAGINLQPYGRLSPVLTSVNPAARLGFALGGLRSNFSSLTVVFHLLRSIAAFVRTCDRSRRREIAWRKRNSMHQFGWNAAHQTQQRVSG